MPSTRRTFLAGASLALVGSVAGCLGGNTTQIGDIRVSNGTESSQEVTVRLDRGGSTVHEGTLVLGVGGESGDPPTQRVIESTWESTPAVYQLTAQVADGPTESLEYDRQEAGAGCRVIDVSIEGDGSGGVDAIVFSSNRPHHGLDCQGEPPTDE